MERARNIWSSFKQSSKDQQNLHINAVQGLGFMGSGDGPPMYFSVGQNEDGNVSPIPQAPLSERETRQAIKNNEVSRKMLTWLELHSDTLSSDIDIFATPVDETEEKTEQNSVTFHIGTANGEEMSHVTGLLKQFAKEYKLTSQCNNPVLYHSSTFEGIEIVDLANTPNSPHQMISPEEKIASNGENRESIITTEKESPTHHVVNLTNNGCTVDVHLRQWEEKKERDSKHWSSDKYHVAHLTPDSFKRGKISYSIHHSL